MFSLFTINYSLFIINYKSSVICRFTMFIDIKSFFFHALVNTQANCRVSNLEQDT